MSIKSGKIKKIHVFIFILFFCLPAYSQVMRVRDPYGRYVDVTGTTTGYIKTTLADETQNETVVRIECTDANAVYSILLPANTVMYEFVSYTGDFFYSPVLNGFSTNYRTHKNGVPYWSFDKAGVNVGGKRLYFKSNEGAIVELTYWVK